MELEPNQNILHFKIVFIGDKSVGKTSIINRFLNDTFTELNMVVLF